MSSPPVPASTATSSLSRGTCGTARSTESDATCRSSSSPSDLRHTEDAISTEAEHVTSIPCVSYSADTTETGYPPPQAIQLAQDDSEHAEDTLEDTSTTITPYEELLTSKGFVSAKSWIDAILLAVYGPAITSLERTPQRDRALVSIYMDHLLEQYSQPTEDDQEKLLKFLNFHDPKVDDTVVAHTILTLTSTYNNGHAYSTSVSDEDTISRLSRLNINSSNSASTHQPTTISERNTTCTPRYHVSRTSSGTQI